MAADIHLWRHNNELGFRLPCATTCAASLEDMAPARAQLRLSWTRSTAFLIDEARTPADHLGAVADRSDLYVSIDKIIPEIQETTYTLDEKGPQATSPTRANDFPRGSPCTRSGCCPRGRAFYDPNPHNRAPCHQRVGAPTSCSTRISNTSLRSTEVVAGRRVHGPD